MRDPSAASRAAPTPRDRRSGAPSPRRMTLVIGIARERYTPTLRKEREGWGTRNTIVRVLFGEKRGPSSEFRLLFAESVSTP